MSFLRLNFTEPNKLLHFRGYYVYLAMLLSIVRSPDLERFSVTIVGGDKLKKPEQELVKFLLDNKLIGVVDFTTEDESLHQPIMY